MGSMGAAPCLLDVVILAGGDSRELEPLSEPKNVLRVCNRPLIWFCLAPWIEAGFRTFFICVNEDYATLHTYLSREFSGVEFYFVLVPLNIGDHPSTTCDAVKYYLKYKESLRSGAVNHDDNIHEAGGGTGNDDESGGAKDQSIPRDPLRTERAAIGGLHRDAILISCDTILAGVDVSRFVSDFYSSLASVSAMMFRPYVEPPPQASSGHATGREKKKKAEAGAPQQSTRKFEHALTCVAYEEEDVVAKVTSGGAPEVQHGSVDPHAARSANGFPVSQACPGLEECTISHRRMHYMCPLDDQPGELRITMPFAGRRPNLTFAADLVDAHVYLVRHWVLHYIAESAGEPDMSVRKDVIPLLTRSQHATVNLEEKVFTTPDKKIGHPIPCHWLHWGDGITIQSLNAAPGQSLPDKADNLRVFCTIYEESPARECRAYRVSTRDNYQALSQEIIAAKCSYLRLDEAPQRSQAGGARGGGKRVQVQASALGGLSVVNGHSDSGVPVLALLLPDDPFTFKERIGSQQMYIVGSFVESAPPPNTYITRSVIGPNVTIGTGARITDSIILSNVEIGSKAVISHSVVGTGALVNGGVRVERCFVAPQCMVEHDEEDHVVE